VERGYIKLWRKTIDSSVFADPILLKLWLLCLMSANHKENFVQVDGISEPVRIGPGQFLSGRYAIHRAFYPRAKKGNKSALTLWRKLQTLEKMQNLNISSHAKYSIITICNWSEYQQSEQQVNNRRTTGEQQVNTNKNDKNEEKYIITSKKKKLNGKRYEAFMQFWEAFGYKKGRSAAADSWLQIETLTDQIVNRIVTAAKREALNRPQLIAEGGKPKWAQGWLTDRRWEDEEYKPPEQEMIELNIPHRQTGATA